MKSKILIRYGEIGLKASFARRRFEKQLIRNIKRGISGTGDLKKERGRIFLETQHPAKVFLLLERVFGVVSFSPCQETDSDPENICTLGLKTVRKIKGVKTFAVRTRRVGNHDFTSQEISSRVGETIVNKTRLKVDLTSPDKTIFVEIRGDKTYMFTEKITGPGGLPIGTEGAAVALIENMDSLAAAWLAMKRGLRIIPVFYKKNKRYLDMLQNWSVGFELKPQTIPQNMDSLPSLLRERRVNALVISSNLEGLGLLRKFPGVLVLTPLIGLDDEMIDSLIKKIRGP